MHTALAQGKPEIFNTDQGTQFTWHRFIDALETEGIIISMDGRGRCMDNIFIERFWRSLKYEDIYLKSYETIPELTQDSTPISTIITTKDHTKRWPIKHQRKSITGEDKRCLIFLEKWS